MATSGSGFEAKISLKILVDTNMNKVVFAEAGKEFVDFLFQIMSLPLSTVSKLLIEKDINSVGCIGKLYNSIESLKGEYYQPNLNKDSILKPRKSAIIVPLLGVNDAPTTISYYRCTNHSNYVTDHCGTASPCCRSGTMCYELSYNYVAPNSSGLGFVKAAVPYIVMDNLEVKPMSISLIKSLVKDFDSLDEREVQVGRYEGLALLKASLEKQAALTSVFLRKKM